MSRQPNATILVAINNNNNHGLAGRYQKCVLYSSLGSCGGLYSNPYLFSAVVLIGSARGIRNYFTGNLVLVIFFIYFGTYDTYSNFSHPTTPHPVLLYLTQVPVSNFVDVDLTNLVIHYKHMWYFPE